MYFNLTIANFIETILITEQFLKNYGKKFFLPSSINNLHNTSVLKNGDFTLEAKLVVKHEQFPVVIILNEKSCVSTKLNNLIKSRPGRLNSSEWAMD